MNVKLFSLLVCFVLGTIGMSQVQAQIGMAVAKDSNGSVIQWSVKWGCGSVWNCDSQAEDELERQGYSKISNQGDSDHGHGNSSGYWVVISGSYTLSTGESKSTVGLGASGRSYDEAERNAVRNMDANNWNWTDDMYYSVQRRGTY